MSDIDDLIDPALLASLLDEAVEPPPPSLRARVLESARRTSRFVRFAPLIAAALDVDEAEGAARYRSLRTLVAARGPADWLADQLAAAGDG